MNGMEPYSAEHEVRLTGGARFIRGFQRIGMAIGGLIFVGGVAYSVMLGLEQVNSSQRKYSQAKCIMDLQRRGARLSMSELRPLEVDLDRSGCSGPLYTEIIPVIADHAKTKPAALEGFFEPAYIGALISGAVGAFVYLGFWLFGWICAGFTKD